MSGIKLMYRKRFVAFQIFRVFVFLSQSLMADVYMHDSTEIYIVGLKTVQCKFQWNHGYGWQIFSRSLSKVDVEMLIRLNYPLSFYFEQKIICTIVLFSSRFVPAAKTVRWVIRKNIFKLDHSEITNTKYPGR